MNGFQNINVIFVFIFTLEKYCNVHGILFLKCRSKDVEDTLIFHKPQTENLLKLLTHIQ